jgi:hypothetical protein
MITKDEVADRIMETELEKIPEKEEVYENTSSGMMVKTHCWL